jgi:hypothetical protein
VSGPESAPSRRRPTTGDPDVPDATELIVFAVDELGMVRRICDLTGAAGSEQLRR